MNKINQCGGFTVVEVLIAGALMTFVLMGMTSFLAYTQNTDQITSAEASLNMNAFSILQTIERGESGVYGIQKARGNSIVIDNNNRDITFDVDMNDEYTVTSADDTEMQVFFDNGDGNDATYEDNVIVIDYDTNILDNEIILANNVVDIQFEFEDDLLTMSVELSDTVRGNEELASFSKSIYVRN